MKLATYKDGSRDGQLVVVSRDLGLAHYATDIASHLQQVLDDWNFLAPQLQDLSLALNHGRARHAFPFDPRRCMAPLPRAYQWVEGSSDPHPVERGAASVHTDPLMYQGGSDDFLGACDDLVCADEAQGLDFGAGLAVVTGDIPMRSSPERALDGIRLLLLANAVSLRHLMPDELARGLGWVQSKPATAFSPVAVTPDELVFNGDTVWRGGRASLTVQSTWNGRKVGLVDAGEEMAFHFGELIAHLCKTRNVRAGSMVGSGAISNRAIEKSGKKQGPGGYGCIADKRAMETLQDGQPSTGYMKYGDTIRIEARGPDGSSVFGAIEQEMTPLP